MRKRASILAKKRADILEDARVNVYAVLNLIQDARTGAGSPEFMLAREINNIEDKLREAHNQLMRIQYPRWRR